MSHNDLISEVARQLSTRFNPSMSMIKKRVENLIDVSAKWAVATHVLMGDTAGIPGARFRYWHIPLPRLEDRHDTSYTVICELDRISIRTISALHCVCISCNDSEITT